MSLEDHLGDIIGKARLHAAKSLEEVAGSAGISAAELNVLEAEGSCDGRPDLERLAVCLGLNAAKLKGIAEGWEPRTVDLTDWRELRILTTSGGGWPVNNYLVWDEATRDAALFDTGYDAAEAIELIDREDLQLRYLFITHSHEDHVAATNQVKTRFPKVRIRTDSGSAPVAHRNRRGECVQLGSLRITNRPTPGHAEDGVTYVIGNWPEDAPHAAIVGDAIFAGSMGRAAGHASLARDKVREQIFSLPDPTLICPGHGPLTSVGEEKANNPFL